MMRAYESSLRALRLCVLKGESGIWGYHTVRVPPGWAVVDQTENGAQLQNLAVRLSVLISARVEADGRPWLHLSMKGHDRPAPSYQELMWMKDTFVGAKSKAIQVLPPRSEEFDVEDVYHLFAPLGVDPLPDFRVWSEANQRWEV